MVRLNFSRVTGSGAVAAEGTLNLLLPLGQRSIQCRHRYRKGFCLLHLTGGACSSDIYYILFTINSLLQHSSGTPGNRAGAFQEISLDIVYAYEVHMLLKETMLSEIDS